MAQKVTKKLYANLKKHYGAIKMLSDRTGLSRQYILAVLKGTYNNLTVLEEGAKLLNELEQERNRRIKAVEKSITQSERLAV